jgi:XTP/dITP diphosphohydrolase
VSRLVLLVTSPRVPAGLLSAQAWDALRAGPVLTSDPGSPQLAALRAAGVFVTVVESPVPEAAVEELLASAAAATGTATWLAGPDHEELVASVGLEVLYGSWDPPGARLLDVVATMDRLRSPGGCPWDAEQTHASLAPYLLEEAYEAFQAIEDGDRDGLREELGDVLLQVAFHARLAEELPAGQRWTIDDVAAGLVEKLIRRHPHVFGDAVAAGSAEVEAGWDAIKAQERGTASALASVALAAPALTLADTLQRKAARLGVPLDLLIPELAVASRPAQVLAAAAAVVEETPGPASAGALLWALVAVLRSLDLDAEGALRARARAFREQVMTIEASALADGEDASAIDADTWRARWLRSDGVGGSHGLHGQRR